MEVVITESASESTSLAADAIEDLIRAKPAAVLGIATGSSPIGIYDALAARVYDGRLSLRQASAFMLDEYVGLPADHPERYRSVVDEVFVNKVDIDPARVHGPDGDARDLVAACTAYEAAIRAAGGIDLQILGLGSDGHIAFNEPSSSLTSRTRVKTLTHQTRVDNARFFEHPDAVPTHCLTQGIGTILESRRIVLVADGEAKAEAIGHVVEGPISARWPGSALQLHRDVTVLVDHAAASRLELADYYQEVRRGKSTLRTT